MPSAPCVWWTSRWTAMPARSSLGAVSLLFCCFFLQLFRLSNHQNVTEQFQEEMETKNNVNSRHSPILLQMLTPSVRLCTPGRKAPCPLWRCLRSPPACCSTTSLVRRCRARGWNPTQVTSDCISILKNSLKNDLKTRMMAFLWFLLLWFFFFFLILEGL